ncbi:MAG: RraA family protein [Gammaproteobacteria bacterium]|nr:RraA family protein [Gammaproteobacteria bacterium]MDE0452307.1 RraA family protein [Gammaproteobacteria bacterium]
MSKLDDGVLEALRALDTPTVCNALEAVAPGRRGYGFTVQPLVCTRPELGSMVGFARTAVIRAMHPTDISDSEMRALREGYYAYIDDGPKPSVVVIQDLDGDSRGYGSFWGEVNSNIHRGLGCIGLVTDGSVRDLPDIADGFQMLADRVGPSHAFVHLVGFGNPVNVAGMRVADGDLLHADRHGAVVVPADVAKDMPNAAALIARREAVIIEASQEPGFNFERLRKAWGDQAEVH